MLKQSITFSLLLTTMLPFCAVSTPDEIKRSLELKPDIDNGSRIYPLCATCHMPTGWGKKDGSFPVIAGQHRRVLIKQLADIRSRDRENPTMYPFTDPASIGGIQAIADVTAYIAQLPGNPDPGKGKGQQLEIGKRLYQQHCGHCHGSRGEGNNQAFFPRISGQHYAYLLRNMKWIRDGYRKNGNPEMVKQVRQLKDNELDAIADYLSRLQEK